jgi:hypothetical protein
MFSSGNPKDREFKAKADDFVRLVYHALKPHTVALLTPTERDSVMRIGALKSLSPCVIGEGKKIPATNILLRRTLDSMEGIWIRELSLCNRKILPIYRKSTSVRAVRLIPFCLGNQSKFLLVIDFVNPPEGDPAREIDPLLNLFSSAVASRITRRTMTGRPLNLPIQIFLRRMLAPFIDYSLKFLSIERLEVLLWKGPVDSGEILEIIGERREVCSDLEDSVFDLGPLSFRWSTRSSQMSANVKDKITEKPHYFPIILKGECVGNLSLIANALMEESETREVLVKIISWSLEKELVLLSDLSHETRRSGWIENNPYQAVIQVLDQWSSASRYKEYLSLGLVHLELDWVDPLLEKLYGLEPLSESICSEVKETLRKGDLLVHCSGDDVALVFPRTSPDGANNALRRVCNLLEGKRLHFNGSAVRVRRANFDVLCYPRDLPTEQAVLERCGYIFLPS